MYSSRNIIFILFLLTHLGSVMSDTSSNCINNIYMDFGYADEKLRNYVRSVWPQTAFLKLDEKDMDTEHGQNYFDHILKMMIHKDSMKLPAQFCLTEAKNKEDFENCCHSLSTKFLNTDNKTDILRDTLRRLKETDFINLNPDGTMSYLDKSHLISINREGAVEVCRLMYTNPDGTTNYRYLYFYYLSTQFQFPEMDRDFPYTPREYCRIDNRAKKFKKHNRSLYEKGEASAQGNRTLHLF